jgi:hypothetical protein
MAVALVTIVTSMLVEPAMAQEKTKPVLVDTVPPVEGVRIELDGDTQTTDSEGRAAFEVTERRGVAGRMVVLDSEVVDEAAGRRFRLNRLSGQGELITIGFDVDGQVSFSFQTVGGTPIEPGELTSVHLKSSVGERLDDIELDRPVWLQATRIQSTRNGPVSSDIIWSVERVMVGNSNVVNRGEVRFTPLDVPEVEVDLLFFSARFRVRDSFTGSPTGKAIHLTDPEGVTTRYEVDENGEVLVSNLPRGDYRVAVEGPGLRIERPVSLSRDQDEVLKLLTWLDLGMVALVGLLFVATPLAIGIRRRRRRLRARSIVSDTAAPVPVAPAPVAPAPASVAPVPVAPAPASVAPAPVAPAAEVPPLPPPRPAASRPPGRRRFTSVPGPGFGDETERQANGHHDRSGR